MKLLFNIKSLISIKKFNFFSFQIRPALIDYIGFVYHRLYLFEIKSSVSIELSIILFIIQPAFIYRVRVSV